MEPQDAIARHDMDDEGVGVARATAAERRAEDDEEVNWWPLISSVAGIFLTLAILVIGLAPSWAVLVAIAAVGTVLAAAIALAWSVVHLWRPVH